MEKILYSLGPLALFFLSLRLLIDAIRSEAGLKKRLSRQKVIEFLRIGLGGVGLLVAFGTLWTQPALKFQEEVAGRPLAVAFLLLPILLLLSPLWNLFGRDWNRLSMDRKIQQLPMGELWRGVWVEVGAPACTNLVLTERGIALALRGGTGLGCAPVAITWGEFTSYRVSEEKQHPVLNVALLDGLVLRVEGPAALRIADSIRSHRAQAA